MDRKPLIHSLTTNKHHIKLSYHDRVNITEYSTLVQAEQNAATIKDKGQVPDLIINQSINQ